MFFFIINGPGMAFKARLLIPGPFSCNLYFDRIMMFDFTPLNLEFLGKHTLGVHEMNGTVCMKLLEVNAQDGAPGKVEGYLAQEEQDLPIQNAQLEIPVIPAFTL